MYYVFLCVQSYPFAFSAAFPAERHRFQPGERLARFDARNVISFIFWRLFLARRICADDSDVVYLMVSARIAGTCAVNILLIDLSVAVLIVRRGRMHTFLSFFNSSLVERQHRLRGNIAYGRDVWQGPCYESIFDLSFDNNGAGYIIISFGAAEKESRSGICDEDSIRVRQGPTS
jgi:hypothetical protein